MVKKQSNKSGFTIIEVVLVLAIAGLIFLMIFIAWPALARTQRDSQRRDDISVFLKKVKDYQTNNRGALPEGLATDVDYEDMDYDSAAHNRFSWSGFYHDYLGETFKDPSGSYYKFDVVKCLAGGGSAGTECMESSIVTDADEFGTDMKVILQATCGDSKPVATNNPRRIAVQYKLEGGGVYCANT